VTTFEFLSYLKTLDIEVQADGDRLRCSGPSAVLTAELQHQISGQKAEILRFLREAQVHAQEPSSLVPLQPAGSDRPLFGVPGHNGDVFCFLPLAQRLGPEQPFYGLQPPGTDGKCEPLSDVGQLAAYFVNDIRKRQPEGPYLLAGYCLGGICAFEIAQQLHSAGQEVALLALFGTTCPTALTYLHRIRVRVRRGALRAWKLLCTLWQLPLHDKTHYLFDKAKHRQLEREQLAAAAADNPHRPKVERATVKAVRRYKPRVYSGRLTVFLSSQKPSNLWDDGLLDWERFTTGRFQSEAGPANCTGDTMLREPHVAVFAELLRSHIGSTHK
jgi:thioesterase domain-containing protein